MKQWTYYKLHQRDTPAERQFWWPGGSLWGQGRYVYENYIRVPILIVYADSIKQADEQFHAITQQDPPINLMGAMWISVEMKDVSHVNVE